MADSEANKFKFKGQSASGRRLSVYDVIDMFMAQIDYEKELQIFNTINSGPKQAMTIKKMKMLGEGGQGFVYLVKIDGAEAPLYADKAFTIV